MIDGRVWSGPQHIAGEWGHHRVDPEGPPCYCGQRGCVETLLCGPALTRAYAAAGGGNVEAGVMASRAQQGDAAAVRVVDRYLEWFGPLRLWPPAARDYEGSEERPMTMIKRSMAGVMLAALVLGMPAAGLAKKTYVYVHDRRDGGGIFAWVLDKNLGLTSIAGSPFPLVDGGGGCGGQCQTMAYSSKRKTLYAAGPTGVSAWTVNKDGTLTSVPGSPFSPGAGGDFLGTGVVQIGKSVFVYAASFVDGNVYAWEADTDGTLTEIAGSPFVSGTGPVGLVVHKKSVFVANQDAATISSYVVEKDGTLTPAPGSPFTPNPAAAFWNVTPDVKGKTLYLSDPLTESVRSFEIEKKTARLTELDDSPFPAVTGGNGVLVTKKLVYSVALESDDDALQPLKIGKKGVLEPTGIVVNAPFGIATFTSDKGGKKMVFAGSDGIATARIDDKKEGSLTGPDVEGFLEATNPNAVVLVQR